MCPRILKGPGKSRKDLSPNTNKNLPTNESDKIRLNKYIASTGLCNRREAEKLIKEGLISVNNSIVKELSTKVSKNDIIKYRGKPIKTENHIYILLNKPKNIPLTTHSKTEISVNDLIKRATEKPVSSAGHIDKKSSGVLLLTDDNELIEKLENAERNMLQIFHVFLDRELIETDFEAIEKGINIEGEIINVETINYVESEDRKQIGIEFRSNIKYGVQLLFEHLNYKIIKLDRVYYAGLSKKGLQRGHWRLLKRTEIANLKMGGYS